jgi:hypothetical protein
MVTRVSSALINTAGNIAYTAPNVSLGDVSNLHITGGTNGQALVTDGAGNLSFTTLAPSGAGIPGGANTQIQYNNSGNFGGSAAFTFDSSSNLVTLNGNISASYFIGNGSQLTGLPASYSNTNVAAYLPTYTGNVAANYFIGNGSTLTSITGGNVTGQVGNALVAGTVYTASQPNITSVGTLNALSISGNINVGGNFTVTGNLTYANVTDLVISDPLIYIGANNTGNLVDLGIVASWNDGTYQHGGIVRDHTNGTWKFFANVVAEPTTTIDWANATYAPVNTGVLTAANLTSTNANLGNLAQANYIQGTLTTGSQPNIISVGTLTNLTVSGNVSTGNISVTGNVNPTSNNFYSLGTPSLMWKDVYIGPGSLYINNVQVIQEVSNNIVFSADANQTMKIATSGTGDIQFAPLGSGVVAIKGTLQMDANYNITSSNGSAIKFTNPVGTDTITSYSADTDITLSANGTGHVKVNDDLIVTGNFTTQGTAANLSVTNLTIQDNIIDINAEQTGTPTGNSGLRVIRGDEPAVQLRWNESTVTWQTTNDGSSYANIANKDANGNITANYVVGNGSTLSSLTGGNVTGQVANALVASTVYTNSQPNITSVGTLTSLNVTGNISTSANLTASYFIGNGSQLTGLPEQYSNTNVAAYLPTYTGNVAANYFIGNGATLTNITGANVTGTVANATHASTSNTANSVAGANVSGQVANALIAGTVYTNAQPNITSLGTLSSLNVTGNLTANYFVGNGSTLSSITGSNVVGDVNGANHANVADTANSVSGSNVSGQVANALIAGTIYTNAQPNITSLGILSSLEVTANVTANYFIGNLNASNIIGTAANANYAAYAGNAFNVSGSNVSGDVSGANHANIADVANSVAGSNVSGQVANALVAGTVYTNAQPNITSVGTLSSLSVTGNVTANYFIGNGSDLTNITGANVTGFVPNANVANTAYSVSASNISGQVANALVAGTVYTNAQPNITSVGTLSGLIVSGDSTITGNLTVTGNMQYINVTTLQVQDPIIELGGGVNGAPLTTNDGKDRGTLLHYYNGTTIDAFMGWDNSNAEFSFGSNVTVTNDVVTFNNLGNIRANYFIGNGSTLTNIIGSNVSGDVNGANHANVADTANSVAGANVSGQVGNALIAGTVYTNAQPNITSVGTLTTLNVTGNVTANYFVGTATNATLADTANSVAGSNVTGQVANALISGTVYTNSQPNITSVGTLSSLTVSGNISSQNANLGNAVVANYFIGDGSLLTGLPASYSNTNVADYLPTYTGNVAANFITATGNVSAAYFLGNGSQLTGVTSTSATTAGTVTTNAQPNITSTGTLSSLTVTGNVDFSGSNVSLGNVSNLHINGGSSGQLLSTDGAGNLSWTSSTASNVTIDTFSGNGVQTTFVLSTAPSNVNNILVNINGATQLDSAYDVDGTNLTFVSAPPNNTAIEVRTLTAATSGISAGKSIAMAIVFGF